MAEWIRLCLASEGPAPDGLKLVRAGEREFLLANAQGGLYASDKACPHLGVSLEMGTVEGRVIRCKAHGYKMDLASGECLSERGLGIKVYPATVRDGWIWVEG